MPRGTCRHAAGHEAWDPSSCAVPQLLLSQLQFARGRAGGERGATVWLVGLLMLAQHHAAQAGLLRQAFGVRLRLFGGTGARRWELMLEEMELKY